MPPKRTPLRRNKPMRKRAKQTPEQCAALKARTEWAKRFHRCWACGAIAGALPLHTHEIIRRSETAECMHPCNFARICWRCHEEAHGGWLTKEILLTLKLLWDGENYNPEWIRKHAIKRHWEPGPLPTQCRWFIST